MSGKTQDGVVVRFSPSPTGNLHIGGARTAIFNYLFCKQNNGKFVLRIEDTDRARSKKEYEDDILDGLGWIGIKHDEMYRQSERSAIYSKHISQLIEDGYAYESKEERNGEESTVVRFKNPGEIVGFNDLIRGKIEFDTSDLGDFVIARSLSEPLYHLAVVVDDYLMGITHVIRGEDHISNTPRQILLQRAIGATEPLYAHIPLILAPDRSKLSKRHGAVSLTEYRNRGFLPQAMINYLSLLGWHPKDEREIFSFNDLLEEFDLKKVQKGGAIFGEEKLRWINKQHLVSDPNTLKNIKELVRVKSDLSEDSIEKISNQILERVEVIGDVDQFLNAEENSYLFRKPELNRELIYWKKDKNPSEARGRMERSIDVLSKIAADDFGDITVKKVLAPLAVEYGNGEVFWPIRYALSGQERSMDPFTISEILGKEETLVRLKLSLKYLNE